MQKVLSHINKIKGFSLIELLVSVSVFLIFVIALNGTMGTVNKATKNSANRERATVLAEEALEATRNIRDADFANLVDGTYGLSTLGNQWNFSGTSDITDIFTRSLVISTINSNQKKVDVIVSWADTTSPTNTVTSSTYFTNWRAILNLGVGLTVNKSVINHGGSKVAADFAPYKVGTTTVNLGEANLFPDGTYNVSETTDVNYTKTFSGDCDSSGNITIISNPTTTCLITNEEKASYLQVNKVVVNHGGTKTASDFTLLVDSNPVVPGATNTFNSGIHTVSETPDPLYTGTISGDCDSSGVVTLSPTLTKICTLTNTEKSSTITVNKIVVGGPLAISNFAPFKVGTTTVSQGVATIMDSGTYTVTETTDANYTQSFSGDCNSSGVVTLVAGQSKVCTITNTYKSSGVLVYGDGTTIPKYRNYINTSDTFTAETSSLTALAGKTFIVKTSPKKKEAIAGFINNAGVLTTMCYDGTSWVQEWTATVGGSGTTRRFDIAYETNSGNVIVLYSTNTLTTNELAYRKKLGSSGCGSANWSSSTNLDPIRTSSIVQWVKMASDRRASSNLITAIWTDGNADLSTMIWNGSAWANEPSAATETSLEVVTAAQDIEDFDVEYESLSGDVMIVWANSAGSNGTNGVRYRTCVGGIATCPWSAVTTPPTFADDATNLDLSANPNTDEMVFASIGNAGSDLQIGYWSGSAWTNSANVDTSCGTPVAGSKMVATGWLVSGSTYRSVIRYLDQGSSSFDWYTGNGSTFTLQGDWAPIPALSSPIYYDIQTDPLNKNQLISLVANVSSLIAKRLVFVAPSTFTWTNSDGAALETTLPQAINSPFSFGFWWQ